MVLSHLRLARRLLPVPACVFAYASASTLFWLLPVPLLMCCQCCLHGVALLVWGTRALYCLTTAQPSYADGAESTQCTQDAVLCCDDFGACAWRCLCCIRLPCYACCCLVAVPAWTQTMCAMRRATLRSRSCAQAQTAKVGAAKHAISAESAMFQVCYPAKLHVVASANSDCASFGGAVLVLCVRG